MRLKTGVSAPVSIQQNSNLSRDKLPRVRFRLDPRTADYQEFLGPSLARKVIKPDEQTEGDSLLLAATALLNLAGSATLSWHFTCVGKYLVCGTTMASALLVTSCPLLNKLTVS